jgi:hypothetical protein
MDGSFQSGMVRSGRMEVSFWVPAFAPLIPKRNSVDEEQDNVDFIISSLPISMHGSSPISRREGARFSFWSESWYRKAWYCRTKELGDSSKRVMDSLRDILQVAKSRSETRYNSKET